MKEDISTMKSNDELNKEEGKKKKKKIKATELHKILEIVEMHKI